MISQKNFHLFQSKFPKNFNFFRQFHKKFRFSEKIPKISIFSGNFTKKFDFLGHFTKSFDFLRKFAKICIFSGNLKKSIFSRQISEKFRFSRHKLAICSYFWANYSISLQKSPLSNILTVHGKI